MRAAAGLAGLGLAICGCLPWQARPVDSGEAAADRVRAGGDELRVRLEGPEAAPALVMIHGFGSSLEVWEPVAAELRASHRVLRLDLPGFGLSSRYEGDYGREALAERVLQVMDAAGIGEATVVGHSLGAAVALTLALRAPDRVDGLVLLSPFTFAEQLPWGLRDARAPGVGELLFGLWFEEHLDWRFAWSMHEPAGVVTEEMLDRARRTLRLRGSRAAALAVVRGMDLEALEARLPELRQRALLVQGQEDRVARPYHAARLGALLPGADLETLADCGHFPMLEAAPRVSALLARWLGREDAP